MFETLKIKSSLKTYEVEFTDRIYKIIDDLIKENAFLIVDSKIYSIYLKDKLDSALIDIKLFLIDAEEENKNLSSSEKLIEKLIANGVKRSSRIVAIGGGITQDIVCFTSSILFRGIPWVFIPTTLLAQADSCIGGKSSINFQNVKNLIGTFNPPDKIYIDPLFLGSLTDEDVKSGIGEMYHYYLYSDSDLIEDLHLKRDQILSKRSLLLPFIHESLSIKRRVIEVDEFDRAERRKFNYGHTFGHAIEALTNYKINHGQAVTIGMDLANFLSYRLDLLTGKEYESLHVLLKANFPDYRFSEFPIDEYCKFLQKDKKNTNSNLTCILSRGIGKLEVYEIELNSKNKASISEYFQNEFVG